ncbi:MAG: pyruvate dehydrogenase [Candidatus Aquicultor primus]|uniref:Pyruvate dehydrogenase n=1 Tax=Candidatus Aquicultor primus TaxID=1797195 RepID=A0A1F2UKQ9_9ACTN|nr:MAG: pyruvate dehydrogenase [Candidatus Aquicultor primus]HCG98864.1 alpha-ketoacid dehydrogenase subunit beta [Actinomycetota bacterium]
MSTANKPKETSYIEAISQALWEELERDPSVFMLGQDIGDYGGAFKVTEGFLDKFGPERIIEMPIAEQGFIGMAIGAALMGMRPIVEVQYADFISCGWDQIVNVAAKMHYRTRDAVPMVIRGPSGGGLRAGPFHSQSPEGWFAHVPGLKVIVPGTAHDAKGLLKAAIRDDNPILYFEHKYLYRRVKEVLPEEEYVCHIGAAKVQREGSDLTIVTYGAMVQTALLAAEKAQSSGVSVEVVDLRTVFPIDKETVLNSVAKTSKAIMLYEDTRTLGIGAEVSAIIAEEGFEHLDGPIIRVSAPDAPVPFSPPLEDYFIPQVEDVLAAIDRLSAY